jgi:cytochrome c oxidase subunit 2
MDLYRSRHCHSLLCGADAWNIERLLEHVPENAEVIKVTGAQWFWTFEHEDGKREVWELHL